MYLTQEQIDVLMQNLRKKHLKMELLDFDFVTIDTLEGVCIGGSITNNADNDIRRSGNVSIAIPTNPTAVKFLDRLEGFSISVGGKIWLDKNIRISVGIENINTNEIVWYKLGVFLINKPTRNFSGSDYSISFECVDLMARLTGKRQGQLTGTTTIIEQGYSYQDGDNTVYHKTTLREALISTITELGNISKYTIATIPTAYTYLPYDIKMGVGSTVYDILKKLLDIISTWQMYFDVDGVFVIEPIPNGKNAIVYDLDGQQYISDNLSADFENVKNQVVVYGKLNELTYYAENLSEPTEYITTFVSNTITNVTSNRNVLKAKVNNNYGIYDFFYLNNSWTLYYNDNIIDTEANLLEYGISFEGTPEENNELKGSYNDGYINVIYEPNGDGTATLILKFLTINTETLTIYGTTFGFMSLDTYNALPITKVEIWNNGVQLLYTHDAININLVKFENSTSEFGKDYSTTQIEVGDIAPNDIYFIRIYDASLTSEETVDTTKSITFELMGHQQASYTLVNDNKESPYYINNGLAEPNYYAGLASYNTTYNVGENYKLTLNNDSVFTSLVNGSIITFMANYNNKYASGINYTSIDVHNSNGTSIVQNIPLVKNSWVTTGLIQTRPYLEQDKLSNDYTIWQLRYETGETYGISINNSTGITNATLNLSTFKTQITDSGTYTINYQGYNWVYDGAIINIANYGITITGTPVNGDSITIDYLTYNRFVLLGRCATAITKIFSSGEYDNIQSDQLAYERCLWELFNASNMNDNISLGVVPNYLLDVNCKIAYNPNDSLPQNIYDTQPYTTVSNQTYKQFVTANNEYFYVKSNEIQYYLTKNITYPLGVDSTAQTISAIRIYDSGNLVGN